MSNKAPLTPGGLLMRKSRIFSMPRPLKPPPTEARSPTATTGFPTHMAVTTTPQARRQCDWGFKYPLPPRTTRRTSTPLIRVHMLDAPEAVTDFRSASDHALTLEKFQEMNIAMVLPGESVRTLWWSNEKGSPLSVFDDAHDFTDMKADRRLSAQLASRNLAKEEEEKEEEEEEEDEDDNDKDDYENVHTQKTNVYGEHGTLAEEKAASSSDAVPSENVLSKPSPPLDGRSGANTAAADFWAQDRRRVNSSADRRWKFRGPWLAGFTDGEFQAYMDRAVRSHSGRVRFRNFLCARVAEDLNKETRRAALRKGRQPKQSDILRPGDVTEEQMVKYLCYLRHDLPSMHEIVTTFLDLAPMKPSTETRDSLSPRIQWTESPWAQRGPPPVHPSAGISYIRTSNFVEMHPLYGPQWSHAAIESRVLAPGTSRGMARIGIGGIVTEPPPDMTSMRAGNDGGQHHLSLDTQGGSKIWMVPRVATVAPTGLVNIVPFNATQQAILVARERRGEDISRELGETLAEEEAERGVGRSGRDSGRRLTVRGVGVGVRRSTGEFSYGQDSWR